MFYVLGFMINVKCIVTNFMREIIVLMNTLTATCENCESKISIVTIDIQCNVLFSLDLPLSKGSVNGTSKQMCF